MPFPKIMTHPQKSMIVRLMTEGKGVRMISKLLKQMYPEAPEMHVSVNTLQAFRKEHLKLEGDALEKVKRDQNVLEREKSRKKEHTQVRNLPSYRKKLQETADVHIDIRKSLGELDGLIRERIEDFFDKAQAGTATDTQEKLLQGYFDRYFMLLDKWAKYVDKIADMRIETNVNVTLIQDQMAVLRRAVLKLLNRMDPEKATVFMQELSRELDGLEYERPKHQSLERMRDEIAALPAAEIEEEAFDDD
jgi:hypothetical protein